MPSNILLNRAKPQRTQTVLLGTRTLTETREQSDSDPDRYFGRARASRRKRQALSGARCFIQLFQERASAGTAERAAVVRTGTATRETRDPYPSRMSLSTKTETRAREEADQDRSIKTYHAIPKF